MLRKLREMQDDEGFTLIELLVVVIIIGILAAIAIPVFLNQREKAYQKAVDSDLRNAGVQIESYFADKNMYPVADTWDNTSGTLAPVDLGTGDKITVSNQVTLWYATFTPSGSAANSAYCIAGLHSQLGTTPYKYYNSNTGGLTTSGTDCPTTAP